MSVVDVDVVTGWVFDLQRFSLHDGPGIRTTVFLKGCPLRCLWCHNPEGWVSATQVRFFASRCTSCGACVRVCTHGVHQLSADGHQFSPAECVLCGACVEHCMMGALEQSGKQMSVEDVLAVVRRDVPFYQQSGGGMTLSGGEPLFQWDFTRALLEAARAESINTAMETTALTTWDRLATLLPLVDLFYVDVKHTDDIRHRELTGVSNKLILENVRHLADAGHPLVVRVPWIPTCNVEESFLHGLTDFLHSCSTPPPVEFLLYHRLGQSKWISLGGESPMATDIPDAKADEVMPWVEHLQAQGFTAKVNS